MINRNLGYVPSKGHLRMLTIIAVGVVAFPLYTKATDTSSSARQSCGVLESSAGNALKTESNVVICDLYSRTVKPFKVKCYRIAGMNMFEGDICLPSGSRSLTYTLPKKLSLTPTGKALTFSGWRTLKEQIFVNPIVSGNPGILWPSGHVYFKLANDLSDDNLVQLDSAMRAWTAASQWRIQFIPWRPTNANYVEFVKSLTFGKGGSYSCGVGMQQGRQEVGLGPEADRGHVLHEIGHVLGLNHEQSRADRNDHVTIHWNLIQPSKKYNFCTTLPNELFMGTYDFKSVMHYGARDFAIAPYACDNDRSQCPIEAKDSRDDGFGDQNFLSSLDAAGVANMYQQ